MKRSAFRPKWTPPERQPLVVPDQPPVVRGVITTSPQTAVVVPKGVKAKPGKRAPNAVEARWIKAAVGFGCVACWLDGMPSREAAFHHVVVGGRRLGHLFGFGLCDPGHHQNGEELGLVSRHPYKARFEAKYGNEMELLALVKKQTGMFEEWRTA